MRRSKSRHRNVRRATAHLERLVRFQRLKVRADIVTIVALLLAGTARFYFPGVPRMIQAICFVAAALAAFTAYTDWRLEREQEAELDELHHSPLAVPQVRLAH